MYDQYSLQYKSDSFWGSDDWIIVYKKEVAHVVNNLVVNNLHSNSNFLPYFFSHFIFLNFFKAFIWSSK